MLLQVVRIELEADRVVSLTLRAQDRRELPGWEPGAHIDLHLAPGLVRQYSLCGDPSDRHTYFVSVLHEVESRGGSAFVHDKLRVGEVIEVSEPRNNFPLEPSGKYVLLAGGIGITPILSMVRQLVKGDVDWKLFYGGQTKAGMAFLDELQSYGPRVEVLPQDETGLLPLDRVIEYAGDGLIYCCGPAPLIDALQDKCAGSDRADRLRFERFTPIAPPADGTDDQPCTVVVSSTGQEVLVPADKTLLSGLRDAGVDVAFSCEEGTCGTCETRVIDGEVDHRDSILSKKERDTNDRMMICVSRAKSGRLVLEL